MQGPLFLMLAALAFLPLKARAFEKCDTIFADPMDLVNNLSDRGIYDGPVALFENALSIRIDTGEASTELIPYVDYDADRSGIIYYPAAFVPVLCRIVLGTYMLLENVKPKVFAETARYAASCIDAGTPFDNCLQKFALDLESRYSNEFISLSQLKQHTAYDIHRAAVSQIGAHEFSHILLEHRRRIADGSLAPTDAEFEADFHAILNGVQIGEWPGAMAYFFIPMAEIERYSRRFVSYEHESFACRAKNVNAIVDTIGATPMLMLDAVDGGPNRLATGSLGELVDNVRTLEHSEPPAMNDAFCGRLSKVVLSEAHGELAHLASLVADYADLLYTSNPNTTEGLGLDTPKAFELITRLETESRDFTHLRNLAAQLMSRLIQRIGLAGGEHALADDLNRILQTAEDYMLARDYGRLLKVEGLIELYWLGEPVDVRLAKARGTFEESLKYSPELVESWLNLALIARAEKRCDESAELADRAFRLPVDETTRRELRAFRKDMKAAAEAGTCAEIAMWARKSLEGASLPQYGDKDSVYRYKDSLMKELAKIDTDGDPAEVMKKMTEIQLKIQEADRFLEPYSSIINGDGTLKGTWAEQLEK